MKIEQHKVGTVDVFTPVGTLVDDDGERFCKMLLERLRSPNPRVVIAMQDVSYMDSQALEGLAAASDELGDRGTALKVANISATCREILELTGIAGRFRFFKDVQDAVRSFL